MRVYSKMRKIGVAIWLLGAVRIHKDGDGIGFVFRIWHPVTWLLLFVMIFPCALMGEKLLKVVPLRLSDYWKRNIDQLQWVTPFTRLDSLRDFQFQIRVPPAKK